MKIAIALRTNKDKIRWDENSNLHIRDPLQVSNDCITADSDMVDKIFIMSLKSMITKVFTVVGSYNLFNRPVSDPRKSMSNVTNPIR